MTAVSLSEFARIVGVSEPTVRKYLPEAPAGVVISKGKNGDAYEIDHAAGKTWWLERLESEQQAKAAREKWIADQQLSLLGDDAAAGDQGLGQLDGKAAADAIRAEIEAIKLGQLRSELVKAADVEAAVSAFLVNIKETFEGLTVRLRRRAEISDDAARVLDQFIAADLNKLADRAAKIGAMDLVEETASAN